VVASDQESLPDALITCAHVNRNIDEVSQHPYKLLSRRCGSPGGETLLANIEFETGEPLLRTSIIRTYRDLFLNVGYELTAETIVPGEKHGPALEVLISLFGKINLTETGR
jgi:hypothetical protein